MSKITEYYVSGELVNLSGMSKITEYYVSGELVNLLDSKKDDGIVISPFLMLLPAPPDTHRPPAQSMLNIIYLVSQKESFLMVHLQ